MAFSIRLVIPENRLKDNSQLELERKTAGFIDDDPDRPLFLTDACEVFEAQGVRFEIEGFFMPPFPFSTEDDLVWLLESLPDFLRFLDEESKADYKMLFFEQGTEIVFEFSKSEGGKLVAVQCLTARYEEMANKTECLSRAELSNQILDFVKEYQKALERYYPAVIAEPWNQTLFNFVARWRK